MVVEKNIAKFKIMKARHRHKTSETPWLYSMRVSFPGKTSLFFEPKSRVLLKTDSGYQKDAGIT